MESYLLDKGMPWFVETFQNLRIQKSYYDSKNPECQHFGNIVYENFNVSESPNPVTWYFGIHGTFHSPVACAFQNFITLGCRPFKIPRFKNLSFQESQNPGILKGMVWHGRMRLGAGVARLVGCGVVEWGLAWWDVVGWTYRSLAWQDVAE